MILLPVPTSAREDRLLRCPGSDVLTTVSVAGLLVTEPEALVAVHV
jgi:hypothetical protein